MNDQNKELREILDEISAVNKAQRASERSKGVILTNRVPNTCINCQFSKGFCCLTGNDIYDDSTKLDSCPIHPLPEEDTDYDSNDEYETGYAHGWDACLREIKKGAEPISC